RFQTPASAIFWGGIWTSLLVLTGSYETLFTYSILAAWIFYTLTVAAVFVLRSKRADVERPYKMWGYPFTLWIFVAVSLWFIGNAFMTQPWPSAMALLIVTSGVFAYWGWRKLATSQKDRAQSDGT